MYKPSIDVTLHSASLIYRDRLLVVILTGMGTDGVIGCSEVKRQRGHVIVEAEESCIVYGMPKAVYEVWYAGGPLSYMRARKNGCNKNVCLLYLS